MRPVLKLLSVNLGMPGPSRHSDSSVQRTHQLQQIYQLNNRIKILSKESWRGTRSRTLYERQTRRRTHSNDLFFATKKLEDNERDAIRKLAAVRRGLKQKDVTARVFKEHPFCWSASHLTPAEPFFFFPSVTASMPPLVSAAIDKMRKH